MIPAPVPVLEVLDQAERFVEALILGEVADALFDDLCRRHGLFLRDGDSPLLIAAMAQAEGMRH